MRGFLLISVAGLLTGCSQPQRMGNEPEADINAAAEAAQGDIDTYAANTLQPAPRHLQAAPLPELHEQAAPAPTPTASKATGQEPANAADGANDAAGVANDYFRLIAARQYDRAYRLWENDGQASGMSQRQFADSFARYADYRAAIGRPGRVDAGAGQRYVEIPVRISGRLAEGGRPIALAGSVTLHRTADIDGATAEQRRWHIRDSSLKPRPGAVAATRTVGYRCAGETRISVRFDQDADTATVQREGRDVATLTGQVPASGIWYKGDGYELRGKGRAADYVAPGRPTVACSAD